MNVRINGAQFRVARHTPEIIPLQDQLPYGLPLRHFVQRPSSTTSINLRNRILRKHNQRLAPVKIASRRKMRLSDDSAEWRLPDMTARFLW